MADRAPRARRSQPPRHRQQRDVHERPGDDAPEDGAGPLRRSHKRDAAQRPEHDAVRLPPHRPARQRVPELVHQHDPEERQVLQHVPRRRRVVPAAAVDLEVRDDQPRPVEEDGDPEEPEEADAAGEAGAGLPRRRGARVSLRRGRPRCRWGGHRRFYAPDDRRDAFTSRVACQSVPRRVRADENRATEESRPLPAGASYAPLLPKLAARIAKSAPSTLPSPFSSPSW